MLTALPAGVVAGLLALGAGIPVVSVAAVYRMPPAHGAPVPGHVIQRTKAVPLPGGGTERKILYWSSKDNGRPTAVSAKLFVPAHPTPHAPVLSLAHGTIGLADCAAPSRDPDAHETELAYFSGLA